MRGAGRRCFTERRLLWYSSSMNDSYIGLVTRNGLQALYPESKHVVRFLERRAFRRPPYSILIWAVLTSDIAECIEYELSIGESVSALKILQMEALFFGTLSAEITFGGYETAYR